MISPALALSAITFVPGSVGLFCSCVQKVRLQLKKPPYNGAVSRHPDPQWPGRDSGRTALPHVRHHLPQAFADAFSLGPSAKMPVTAIYLLCDLARISEDCLAGRLTGATLGLSAKTISVVSPPNHFWRFEIGSPGSTGTSQHVQDLEKLIPESLMRS